MLKRFTAISLVLTLVCSLTACTSRLSSDGDFAIGMVSDVGGINDQSFNQSAWAGMTRLKDEQGVKISYIESKQESEFATNLGILVDQDVDLIWGIGFAMADALISTASLNEDLHFAIVDNSYDNTPENVTGVRFKSQEGAFLVGYIAALTTKTNKVGFVGGQTGFIIDQFEYGYKAGVEYGAKELGKVVTISLQYADSFTDAAKGKAIANKMYSSGCDIIFHASGAVGNGVIEAAKDNNKYVIGVDSDQSYLAPQNVLTSALKNVDVAVENVALKLMNGEEIGGQTMIFGIAENGVGIPQDYSVMGKNIYDKAMILEEKIKSGEVVPPGDKESYSNFKA